MTLSLWSQALEPSRDPARLVEIMKALRDPQSGCPWDLEQTFDSIVPYTVEETYEVVDAIERRDPDDLREELGDLLLQVVYYAQLAAEAGLFDFDDVVEGITQKMIRRHPHVFGDEAARTARSAKGQWNRIKAEEKAQRSASRARRRERVLETAITGADRSWLPSTDRDADVPRLLGDVPGAFPALLLARKLQEKAATVGFDWTEPAPILAKLREETAEFESAAASEDRRAQADELGDILFTVVNLARRYDIDADAALRGTVSKFRTRFSAMEDETRARGVDLASLSLDEQEALWVKAKSAARPIP